jgi:VIT1/CCC1 family predicted Fe2+/Mn2+ transporter
MTDTSGAQRGRLLDPLDRVSEILFGLIMAVTIVGSLSIATAGHTEVRAVLIGALGCNIAWGLVDAVMYVLRGMAERARQGQPSLRRRDFVEAAGIFALVVLATFPVVLPFIFLDDTARAMTVSRVTTLFMLFLAGMAFARYAGHAHPMRLGVAMAVFGAILIAAVMALGG